MCGEKCQVGSDRAFDPFGFHIGDFMLAAGQGRFFQATAAVSGAGEASPLPRASDSRARRHGDCLPCGPRFNERMPEPARQTITFAEMRAAGVRGRPSAFAFKYPTRL
jgi:hypothetical protein